MEPLDPHYFLGPSGWRLEHAQELKKSYAESRRLRHIRILDWLPIMHAFHIPKFQVSDLAVEMGPKLTLEPNVVLLGWTPFDVL